MFERVAALNGRKEWGGSDPEQLEMFMNGPTLWPTKLSQAGDLEKRRKPLIVHTMTNLLSAAGLYSRGTVKRQKYGGADLVGRLL